MSSLSPLLRRCNHNVSICLWEITVSCTFIPSWKPNNWDAAQSCKKLQIAEQTPKSEHQHSLWPTKSTVLEPTAVNEGIRVARFDLDRQSQRFHGSPQWRFSSVQVWTLLNINRRLVAYCLHATGNDFFRNRSHWGNKNLVDYEKSEFWDPFFFRRPQTTNCNHQDFGHVA